MSETRWTPGPWRWWTSNSRLRLSSDATGKDGDVLYAERLRDGADVVVSNPADRSLIAAAPDLAEACAQLLSSIEDRWCCERSGIVEQARAALARARGEEVDRG